MMLHEATPDVHRIAEHAKRCLPLLRDNAKREVLLDLLSDAGDSARARGAHEVCGAHDSYNCNFLNPVTVHTARSPIIYQRLCIIGY